ncbi:MAG: chromophore lyase CpcT/CpeT [Cyclobacteriaceae bacterium]|nr:chromophore lyase CpcT/CpeT [Cyclobacteriaceae bacterium HetDA_MAG_MS6]
MTKTLQLVVGTVIAACCISGCQTNPKSSLDALQDIMTGHFSSEAQSRQDSNFFHITLHMYPIWKDKDGKWLYVEQASATQQDKPYRQRVYQLTEEDGGLLVSKVYSLENEDKFVGKWQFEGFFDQFDTGILKEREGCAVYLKKTDKGFEGATKDKMCTSTLRGASWASSKVTITKDRIVSWDQGFDADDNQVWGATSGGYVFDRIE